jgi:hypothetical protein
MKILKYDIILESVQALAHHSETYGNIAVAMRRRIRQTDGSFSDVPIITGDTMRHGLRESAAYALLDAAGLLDSQDLSEPALRLLFAGGMIVGNSGGAAKLGDYRKMVDLIPPLALLGGCAQNRSIPGRMTVDDALLICEETSHILPEYVISWLADHQGSEDIASARSHVEEVQRVRMDPSLDPGKRRLLTEGAQAAIENRLLSSESASERGDLVSRDQAKSTMLPRSFETVVQGSLWYWSVEARCWDDMDEESFHVMLSAFLSNGARVGGKRATGHGLVRPIHGWNCHIRRPSENLDSVDIKGLGHRVGTMFRNHVAERSEQIAEFLRGVKS